MKKSKIKVQNKKYVINYANVDFKKSKMSTKQPISPPSETIGSRLTSPLLPKDSKGVFVPLTAMEFAVLEDLSKESDLPPERVMIQALRVYQLYRTGEMTIKDNGLRKVL
jgi:hypothetical protein